MSCHGCGKSRRMPPRPYPYAISNPRPTNSPAGGETAAGAPSAGDSTEETTPEEVGEG